MNLEDIDKQSSSQRSTFSGPNAIPSQQPQADKIQGLQGVQSKKKASSRNPSRLEQHFIDYGTLSPENQSFTNLDQVRNIRTLRKSQTSSKRNSVMGGHPFEEHTDDDESQLNSARKQLEYANERPLQTDDYLLFVALLGLTTFELLALLRLDDSIDWYWIIIILPLKVCLFISSYIAFKKIKPMIAHYITTPFQYGIVIGVIVITTKTLLGLITCLAIAEIYPSLLDEIDYIVYTLIGLMTLSLFVSIYYYKPMKEHNQRLPFLLIQNVLMLEIFVILTFLHFKTNEPLPTFVLTTPVIINFALNIINAYYYMPKQKRKMDSEVSVNMLLEIAAVWVLLYLQGVLPYVFSLGHLLIYLIFIEAYFFTLSLELNDEPISQQNSNSTQRDLFAYQ